MQSSHRSCVGNGDKNYPLQVRTCGYAIRSPAKLWVKPSLDGGCCRFAITNGHDSIPIWSLEKWADGSLAVSLIRAVVGEPFWIASTFQPSESPGQSTLPTSTSFCCCDFLPFSLLCFVLSPWRGEAGGGGGKVGGGGCLASLAPPIQTSFHLKSKLLSDG